MYYVKWGGVYLDTDVEILAETPFEQYLNYNVVMCFENARGINTGLFFAAEKGSHLCIRFLEPYMTTHYTKESQMVNTAMNKPVIREFLPELKWNGETQRFQDTYIIGCEEYGRFMKHHGTRSWCDNLPPYNVSKDSALKSVLRKPEIFERLEHNRIGRRILPVYTFLSYDLLDLGPMFYIKLFYNNHIKSIRK